MTVLCDLAEKYMTDRGPQGLHHYTQWYYEEYKDRRDAVKKVLEIGVGGSPSNRKHNPDYIIGAGLYMWRDFFPNATIYGVDILPELMFESERIQTFLCNQTDRLCLLSVLEQTGTDLDLVIDDASHRPEDQVFTALLLLPCLQSGALYVIEDIYDPAIVDRFQDYNCELVQPWRRYKRDDRLIVVRL